MKKPLRKLIWMQNSIEFDLPHGKIPQLSSYYHQASGTPDWDILFGMKLQTTVVIYCQIFIITELMIYFVLFHDIYRHNQTLVNGNSLGISQDTLRQRKRKNIITLCGQCVCFLVEILVSTILLVVEVRFGQVLIFTAFHTAAFFLASPELKKYYFNCIFWTFHKHIFCTVNVAGFTQWPISKL